MTSRGTLMTEEARSTMMEEMAVAGMGRRDGPCFVEIGRGTIRETMYQRYQIERKKKKKKEKIVTWRPAPMELMRKPFPRRRTVSRVKTADHAMPLPPGTCILVLRVSSG